MPRPRLLHGPRPRCAPRCWPPVRHLPPLGPAPGQPPQQDHQNGCLGLCLHQARTRQPDHVRACRRHDLRACRRGPVAGRQQGRLRDRRRRRRRHQQRRFHRVTRTAGRPAAAMPRPAACRRPAPSPPSSGAGRTLPAPRRRRRRRTGPAGLRRTGMRPTGPARAAGPGRLRCPRPARWAAGGGGRRPGLVERGPLRGADRQLPVPPGRRPHRRAGRRPAVRGDRVGRTVRPPRWV